MAKIEIACFNTRAAQIAQDNGAHRVELCAEMELGGTTPSVDDVRAVRDVLDITLHVMIRPRGGDFVYSVAEFEQMKSEIASMKNLGVDGFVFGILQEDSTVDVARNSALVALASPLPCTFHRAFDEVPDMAQALEEVIACGFSTILTSGLQPNVELGLSNLAALVRAADERITIMPGGGLRSTNLTRIAVQTGADYFHSSAITDGGDTAVAEEVRALCSRASLSPA